MNVWTGTLPLSVSYLSKGPLEYLHGKNSTRQSILRIVRHTCLLRPCSERPAHLPFACSGIPSSHQQQLVLRNLGSCRQHLSYITSGCPSILMYTLMVEKAPDRLVP